MLSSESLTDFSASDILNGGHEFQWRCSQTLTVGIVVFGFNPIVFL